MAHLRGGVILEENQGYVIRRTILFDNKCGFVLGEDPKAPNPYVTWQFNEQDGHRDYFWGHYHNEPDMAERGNIQILLYPAAYRHGHLSQKLFQPACPHGHLF